MSRFQLADGETRCRGVNENLGKSHATRVTCVRRFECARYQQRLAEEGKAAAEQHPLSDYYCQPGADQFVSAEHGPWV